MAAFVWKTLPASWAADGQEVWVRTLHEAHAPFKAVFTAQDQCFSSIHQSEVFGSAVPLPWYLVAHWREVE